MTNSTSILITIDDLTASAIHDHDCETFESMLEAERFGSALSTACLYVEMRSERSFSAFVKKRIAEHIATGRNLQRDEII